MADKPTGLPKPKSYFFLPTRIAGPVPPSSESRQPIATSNRDLGGSSTLLKNVNATILAISTRFEVAAMDKLMAWFIESSPLQGANEACRPASENEVRDNFPPSRTCRSF